MFPHRRSLSKDNNVRLKTAHGRTGNFPVKESGRDGVSYDDDTLDKKIIQKMEDGEALNMTETATAEKQCRIFLNSGGEDVPESFLKVNKKNKLV